MDEPDDFYTVLGVERDATLEAIKKAHRKLARQYHPDVSKDPKATEKFQDIQEAYDVLSDEVARADYDVRGKTARREDREVLCNAETMLVNEVLKWANDPNNDHTAADLIPAIVAVFQGIERQAETNILEGDKITGRLTRTINKLKHRGRRDFLTIALEARVANIREQQNGIRATLGAVKLAQVLIKEYDFECIRRISGYTPTSPLVWTTLGG